MKAHFAVAVNIKLQNAQLVALELSLKLEKASILGAFLFLLGDWSG